MKKPILGYVPKNNEKKRIQEVEGQTSALIQFHVLAFDCMPFIISVHLHRFHVNKQSRTQ